MIDPKYSDRIRSILELRFNREPSDDEVTNSLKDANIAAELLLQLHEESQQDIAALAVHADIPLPSTTINSDNSIKV